MFQPYSKTKFIKHFLATLFVVLLSFCFSSKTFAATLSFNPSSGNFTVGNIFTVDVLVNTENISINNTEAVINYPTDLLEVVSVSKSNSIFTLWVEEPNFSSNAGTLSFNGGIPTPGYTGSAGKTFSVVFRAKKAGGASLIFSSASVLANDGLGTDVLKVSTGAKYSIVEGVPSKIETPPAPVSKTAPLVLTDNSPVITSETHPDQTKWYANSDANFIWDLPPGAKAVRMQLDTSPFSVPTFSYGLSSYKEISAIDQGISYFHLRIQTARGWGEVGHYKVQIDTGKPKTFDVKEVPRSDLTNPKLQFIVEAEDEISGIDHYEITIDGGKTDIMPVSKGNTYETATLSVGHHTFYARAVDKAGNYLERSLQFDIEQPIIFTIGKWTFSIIAILIPLLLVIFLMAILIVYLYFKFDMFRKRIRREADEAEYTLEKSFAILREDIKNGAKGKKLADEFDDAEKAVKKEIKDIITK